jgi:phage shock protein C
MEGKVITMERKLTKSTTNKMLAGVCGGLAEYFQVDATIIRLLWVVFSLCGGSGVLAYIAAAIIMPNGPETL